MEDMTELYIRRINSERKIFFGYNEANKDLMFGEVVDDKLVRYPSNVSMDTLYLFMKDTDGFEDRFSSVVEDAIYGET